MCVSIPGRILAISDHRCRRAQVTVLGTTQEVGLACIGAETQLDDLVGEWVLIHLGFAMSRISADQAHETLSALHQAGIIRPGDGQSTAAR